MGSWRGTLGWHRCGLDGRWLGAIVVLLLWRMVRQATRRSAPPGRLPTGHTGGTSDASAQREEVECRP